MIEEKIKQNIPLAPMTTFKIGGAARFYIEVETKDELKEAIRWSLKNNRPYFILGGGSNILVNDNGVDGLVIRINNTELKIDGDKMLCGAGLPLAKAMMTANGNELGGMEWAIGIPGTIGGAVRGNAGAFGNYIGQTVEKVDLYNVLRGNFEELDKKDCEFGYRESVFKKDKNLIVWNVRLKLEKKNIEEIKNQVGEYLLYRQKAHPKLPSAGSVFKNITLESLRASNEMLAKMAESLGKVKHGLIGAGWIVDLLGFKGRTIGGAKVSLEHGNFIVNTGQATAEDVIMLISLIKQQARTKLGVQLCEEIQYFGI